jgi:molybdate transport system permease protein
MEVWPALSLSLRIAITATVLTFLLAVPLAYGLSRRRFVGKSLIEAAILMPMVLPPTVVGYLLIVAFGAQSTLGRWLKESFGYSILFRFEGAVLAATVVAIPLLYLPAKAAFASIERELEDIARLAGASRLQLFWHVSLPLARRGLLSGTILAFGRAIGEFGATLMVFGLQSDRQTLPISIYLDFEQGQMQNAALAVAILSGISFLILAISNLSSITRPAE